MNIINKNNLIVFLDDLKEGKNNLNNIEFYKTKYFETSHGQGASEEFCISRYIFSNGEYFDIYTHKNFNDYMYSETASKIIKKHFLIIL